jgi:hypothetical protein
MDDDCHLPSFLARTSQAKTRTIAAMGVMAGTIFSLHLVLEHSHGPVGRGIGLVGLVLSPVVFGRLGLIGGYLGTAITCLLYNYVAKHIGGIEIRVESETTKDS